MLGSLKDKAMKTAGQLLGSAPAAGVLTNPKVQDLVRRVVDLRADVRDGLDDQIAAVARRLNLVSMKELRHFKRLVRELENQVATLEHELAQQRRRADRAEAARADREPAATKKATTKKATTKKAASKKATTKKTSKKAATKKKATTKKAAAKKTSKKAAADQG